MSDNSFIFNRQIYFSHDSNCNAQALELRQILSRHGAITEHVTEEEQDNDRIFAIVYNSKEGYEEAMIPVRNLNSKYPVLAIFVNSEIPVPQEDSVIFIPYNFEIIIKTIKALKPIIPLEKFANKRAWCWRAFLMILLFALSFAPIVEVRHQLFNIDILRNTSSLCPIYKSKLLWDKGEIALLESEQHNHFREKCFIVSLVFAGIIYLVAYVGLLIYLVTYCQRYRQLRSIDNLRLFMSTLTDYDQKKKASERMLNFYLEETEKQ